MCEYIHVSVFTSVTSMSEDAAEPAKAHVTALAVRSCGLAWRWWWQLLLEGM